MPQDLPNPSKSNATWCGWASAGLARPNAREFYLGLATLTVLGAVAMMRAGPQPGVAATPRPMPSATTPVAQIDLPLAAQTEPRFLPRSISNAQEKTRSN